MAVTPADSPDPSPPARDAFKELHLILVLPWWVAAALTAFLAVRSSEFQNVSLMLLGVATLLALSGLAVLTTRGGRLILTAVVGSVVAFGGWAGMGIQFIDHTPTGMTGTAWTLLGLASIAALISGVIALVIGVLEIRRGRRPPRPPGGVDPANR